MRITIAVESKQKRLNEAYCFAICIRTINDRNLRFFALNPPHNPAQSLIFIDF